MAEDIGALPYILDEIQVKRLYLPETEKVYTENFMQAIYSRIAKQDVVYYNKGTLKAAEVQIHISDLNTNPAKKSEGEVTPEILCFREKIPYNTDLSLCGTVEYYVNQDGIKKIYTTRNPQEEY